jgi:sarcosine oxidase, subunit gamma
MSRRGPIDDLLALPGQPLALAQRAPLGHINLRGDPNHSGFDRAVRALVGAAPCAMPNTVALAGAAALIWLGPDEWLVQLPEAHCADLLARARAAFADMPAAVTDLSDGLEVLVLDHPRAAAILARGCPLDLHDSAFAVGSCAQSVFGKTGLLLVRESPQRFALTVRRSFARYLYGALQDAARMELAN